MSPTSCPACGGEASTLLFEKDGHRYRACDACGLASLSPLPEGSAATALYGDAYFEGGSPGGYLDYEADAAAHRRNARARLARLAREGVAPPGRILDVGCAAGFFLEEARAAGFEVAGMDVSPWARERTRARLGIEVAPELGALSGARAGDFDVVCLAQVLEHEPHPDRMLAAAHRLLRTGGSLYVETWDRESLVARLLGRDWQQVTPPSVVHLFGATSLRRILARAGFGEPRLARGRKWVSVGFAARLVAEKYGSPGRALRRIALAARLGGRAVPYALGDLVELTAPRLPSRGDS